MSLRIYMDVHVPRAITRGLVVAGVDVLTAQEAGASEISDPELLNRATALGRVLFTRDENLLAESTRRQRDSMPFSGVVYAHQMRVNIGQCIHDLHLLAECLLPSEVFGHVIHLPIK